MIHLTTLLAESKLKLNIPTDIIKIYKLFKKNNKQLYVVGGAVRDAVLGKRPKDFDLATDAKTGLHLGTSNLRDLAHKGATGVKAAWDTARGKGPKEATGGGGTGASAVAMGSDTGVKEDSKIGDKGKQFDTGKKKRLTQSKRKFKVQVA